jgi:hypothetical protein
MGPTRSLNAVVGAARSPLRSLAMGCAWACMAGAASAGAPSFGTDDLPPPIDTRTADDAAAGARPPVPAITEPGAPATATAETPSAPQPAPVEPQRDAQIEQKHVGRRVSEVIVTPAGFTYHYTMTHLDDQEIGTLVQPHPQLSVPSLIRFDFNF